MRNTLTLPEVEAFLVDNAKNFCLAIKKSGERIILPKLKKCKRKFLYFSKLAIKLKITIIKYVS